MSIHQLNVWKQNQACFLQYFSQLFTCKKKKKKQACYVSIILTITKVNYQKKA